MNDSEDKRNFWIGNALLAAAMLLLLDINQLWAAMGIWAMVLWVAMASAGAYFLMVNRKK